MPIAQHAPATELNVKPNLPKAEPIDYKSTVYDDNYKPLHSLLAYVSGSPWSVDYYGQIVGAHNDLREVDPGQSATYQTYTKTIGLEIRVNTPLASTTNNETGLTTVTGTATVYPFVTPNVSDYFIAEAADNEKAIFRITQVDRKTFNRDSAYSIDYDLVGYIGNSQELYNDLEVKAVRSFTFSKERLVEGLSPTLKTEEYSKITNLKALYSDLVKYYYSTFFDRRYSTLVLPGQSNVVYDPGVVKFLSKIVDSFDAPEFRLVKEISTDNDPYLNQSNIWDLMLRKDFNGLTMCNDEMGLVNKAMFITRNFVRSIAYSNIDYVIYPVNPDISTVCEGYDDVKLLSMETLETTTGFKGSEYPQLTNTYTKAGKTYNIIYPIVADSKYVFTSNLYSNTTSMSLLEILVKDYLKGLTMDLDMLYAVTDKYRTWNRLEQFYYGAILLGLIKEASRAQYS